jgi:UDP-N-acetylglucosamine/UDP-N-acetyl-alpha-D-glucosaminouronate 4-epimerase
MQNPQECFDVNITGTQLLFEAALKAGVRRVVIASSSAVYGDTDAMPLSEKFSVSPLSPYAASKCVCEMLGAFNTQAFGLEVVTLRYFNVYGPLQRPDSMYAAAIPIFLRQMLNGNPVTIFGDGRQTRDFVFIDDVVRANLLAADHPAAAGQIINICSGAETSLLDLLDLLYKLLPDAPRNVFDKPRKGDIYKSLGSAELAEHVIGFKAQTDLANGLKATLNWMIASRQ